MRNIISSTKVRILNTLPVICVFMAICIFNPSIGAESKKFDHFATGFPLSGMHVQTDCEACHIKGVFSGTPKTCYGCHNNQIAGGKDNKHIVSDNNCDNCHTTFSWQSAAVDHNSVIGSCSTCHNGSRAAGKPARHTPTTSECDTCHRTVSWVPASFNHSNVTGPCQNCHNGQTATGKHVQHIATTQDCGECHNTISWSGANFNHADVTGRCDTCHVKDLPRNHIAINTDCGDCHNTNSWSAVAAGAQHNNISGKRCDSCHNGQTATGKDARHVVTPEDCGHCHTLTAWIPANFDHSTVSGSCSSCHISHKPNNHFITSKECNACHNTTTWVTVNFTHSHADYPGDHRASVNCIDCHTGNSEAATWNFPAYKPDCAGCHANRYKMDSHKHIVGGLTVFYTVDELRNCAGSCHKENVLVNQHHRTSDGNW